MSKVGNNPILKTVHGMLGDVVVYRRVRGKLLMCNAPKKRDVLTPNQAAKKEMFLEAVAYAKAQVADPVLKAEYETGINDRLTSAYSVAVTDYLKAPTIKYVDTAKYDGTIGNVIEIKAVDDFKVVSVEVEIRAADNALIERGNAVLRENSTLIWLYTITQANAALAGTKITVRAKDKPGNITVAEQVL